MFGQLLCLPHAWGNSLSASSRVADKPGHHPNLDYLIDNWGAELRSDSLALVLLKCLNKYGGEDSVFTTEREFRVKVDLKRNKQVDRPLILWIGIYRSDGIYCYGGIKELPRREINSEILACPKLRLLPGEYRISVGVWDPAADKFLLFSHGLFSFNIISDKMDHGTVYLEHNWKFKLPGGRKR